MPVCPGIFTVYVCVWMCVARQCSQRASLCMHAACALYNAFAFDACILNATGGKNHCRLFLLPDDCWLVLLFQFHDHIMGSSVCFIWAGWQATSVVRFYLIAMRTVCLISANIRKFNCFSLSHCVLANYYLSRDSMLSYRRSSIMYATRHIQLCESVNRLFET